MYKITRLSILNGILAIAWAIWMSLFFIGGQFSVLPFVVPLLAVSPFVVAVNQISELKREQNK